MNSSKNFIFTSESVSEGHPDKICDQISDAILDRYMAEDSNAKVACECLVTTDFLCIAGEVGSHTTLPVDEIKTIAKKIIQDIGYTHPNIGFDANTVEIMVRLHQQSQDIAQGIDGTGLHEAQGAGDQGIMFGFSINETADLMPMPIYYAHRILKNLAELRHKKEVSFLLPDAKAQVSVLYKDGLPINIPTVVISSQHTEEISHQDITDYIIMECIQKCIPEQLLQNTQYWINPTGRFIIGGPHGDSGLTGRKVIVDTYGGYAKHGGGAFSGKDSSKVDRSAAYMMRYLAKNIVGAGLATACEIQVAYAIGVAEPVSLVVDTFSTGKIDDTELTNYLLKNCDLTPSGINKTLSLRHISYLPSSTYGHFGRQGESFTWEKLVPSLFASLL